jgi:hypothetical protein
MALGPGRSLGRAISWIFLVSLALLPGCDRSSREAAPATAPATEAVVNTPKLTVLPPETESWSAEEALAFLGDPQRGVRAAVRLARLSGLKPLCLPTEMTDVTASCLQVAQLSDELWALGLVDRHDDGVLRAPVLITNTGAAVSVASGTEEELLCLHLAQDPDVFPHLLVSPRRVWVTQTSPEQALSMASPDCVGFCWRSERSFPYVALVGGQGCNFAEVARYLWDPYELAFTGPAADALPDPPGGKFELDLPGSPKLIPMGGEIPEPKPIPKEPFRIQGDDLALVPADLKPAGLGVEARAVARYLIQA